MFQAAFPHIGGRALHCLEKISGSFESFQCISATIESRNIRHLYYIIFTVFRKPECNNTDINYTAYNHTESIKLNNVKFCDDRQPCPHSAQQFVADTAGTVCNSRSR